MPKMVTVICKSCKTPFKAREADRKRGWGQYCSKSCKAIRQTQVHGRRPKYPRHDGKSPMKYKFCCVCHEPAVNGVYTNTVSGIDWFCEEHMAEATTHPFSSDALGQW